MNLQKPAPKPYTTDSMASVKLNRSIAKAIIVAQLVTAPSATAFHFSLSSKKLTWPLLISTKHTQTTNISYNLHLHHSLPENLGIDDTKYHSFNHCNDRENVAHQKTIHSRRHFNKHLLAMPPVLSFLSSQPQNCKAISPQEASRTYDIYASTYDDLDGGSIASSLGIDDARNKLLSMARGNVLEVGVGTGLNLQSYRFCPPPPNDNEVNSAILSNNEESECVTAITLVDISEKMLLQARSRIASLKNESIIPKHIPINIIQADATTQLTQLFGENIFDTVVDTFSLCVMGNEGARKCLEQLTSVVKERKNRGQILLIENSRAENPILGYYQDVTANAAADMGGKGCLYNQNVGNMIGETMGLKLMKEEKFAGGIFRSFVCAKEE
ncbi:hypothetical protein ACHAXS_005268 [Conticribra weissflogii]